MRHEPIQKVNCQACDHDYVPTKLIKRSHPRLEGEFTRPPTLNTCMEALLRNVSPMALSFTSSNDINEEQCNAKSINEHVPKHCRDIHCNFGKEYSTSEPASINTWTLERRPRGSFERGEPSKARRSLNEAMQVETLNNHLREATVTRVKSI
uniref:Uncharacterized protein n=1 Tax=Nelumbo nucifera TaxID=4432 RepID=A0A822ZPP8_NELNU|nr:TPA_asm: hypothetical protein HUJ06_016804 [Nelumbo nucifera]